MTIKTKEWYTKYAKEFVKREWNKEFNIPIELYRRVNGSILGSFYREHTVNNKRIPKRITLNIANQSHEGIVNTLKHELCHWYCFVEGKDYRDGDRDFEETLFSIGAGSTHSRGSFGDRFYQQSVINNEMTKLGYKGTSYERIQKDLDYIFESTFSETVWDTPYGKSQLSSGFDVHYKGEVIGSVFQLKKGQWVGMSEEGTMYPDTGSMTYYTTRKYISELMIIDYLQSKEGISNVC